MKCSYALLIAANADPGRVIAKLKIRIINIILPSFVSSKESELLKILSNSIYINIPVKIIMNDKIIYIHYSS